jgi:HEAT repeat protein
MASPSPNPTAVYPLLATVRNAAADRMLLAALPQLDAPQRGWAIEVLLERQRPAALHTLVANFPRFPAGLQGDLLTRTAGLEQTLQSALEHPDVEVRGAAIQIIVRSGEARLAYLLNLALTPPCPITRERAAQALLTFAERYRAQRSAAAKDAAAIARLKTDARHLSAAFARSLQMWNGHLRSEVLMAAACVFNLVEAAVAELVEQPRSHLAQGLQALLAGPADPRWAAFLLRALAIPGLRPHAARAIARCTDDTLLAALLDECWVLKDPAVRKGCAAVRELRWLQDSVDALLRLPPNRAAPALRLIGASGIAGDAKVGLLRDVIAYGDAHWRRAALWQLVHVSTDSATDALRAIAGRRDGVDVELARYEVHARNRRQAPLQAPARSTRPAAPSGAPPPSAGEPLDVLFRKFATGGAAQRARLLQDPFLDVPGLVPFLRGKLAAAPIEDRVAALQLACLTGVAPQLEEPVRRLAQDPDALTRAHAVSALGRIATPATVQLLRRALHDPDFRVQANAIEALDALGEEDENPQVEAKLDSPNSRVRANAVKALLKHDVRRAADVLVDMLDSDARADRLSALWVVQRLNLASLLRRVEKLAAGDADSEVRRRAEAVVKAWSGPDGLPPDLDDLDDVSSADAGPLEKVEP